MRDTELWTAVGRRPPTGQEARVLDATVAEIEAHVNASGWDRGPALFALVRAARFAADEPDTAHRLAIDQQDGDALTPIEQDDLPDEPLDEVLAGIGWPASVEGCALSQEIVILPPSVQQDFDDEAADAAGRAAAHPERREARLVVGVLRDGSSMSLLRMRADGTASGTEELLTGADLAPNLVEALLATLA